MQRIEPGSARWNEVRECAIQLRAEGMLTHANLKHRARVGGEVAAKVLREVLEKKDRGPVPAAEPIGGSDGQVVDAMPERIEKAFRELRVAFLRERDGLRKEFLDRHQVDMDHRARQLDELHAQLDEVTADLAAAGDVAQSLREESEARAALVASLERSLAREVACREQAEAALAAAELRIEAARSETALAERARAAAEGETSALRVQVATALEELVRLRSELAETMRRADHLTGRCEELAAANAALQGVVGPGRARRPLQRAASWREHGAGAPLLPALPQEPPVAPAAGPAA